MSELNQSLSARIITVLSVFQRKPYSIAVGNLILAVFALIIIAAGVLFVWALTHQSQFRVLLIKVRDWSIVQRIRKIYEQGMQFLVCRFSVHGAYGIFFTIGFIIFCGGIWTFVALLQAVINQNSIVQLDAPIIAYIAAHREVFWTASMRFMTILGDGWFVIPAAIFLGIFFWYTTKTWQAMYVLLTAVGGAGILDVIFKALVARPRPMPLWQIAESSGYAFPSGHAALTVFYIITAYLVAQRCKGWYYKVLIWGGGISIALLIGISRVYLGVHWPTDVFGGWALASILGSLVISVTASTHHISHDSRELPSSDLSSQSSIPSVSLPSLECVYHTPVQGLRSDQVIERQRRGDVNVFKLPTSRSIWQICSTHILTRFNALLGTLLVITMIVGQYRDALFGIVIVLNTAIGIIQELRSKWTLDRLALLTMTQVEVIRDGQQQLLPIDHIVIDDVLGLHTGNQIPVDGIVIQEEGLEIDESQLTGESEPVRKAVGDCVYSGSFIIAGEGKIQAIGVGEKAYVNQLAKVAQRFSLAHSELRAGINKILQGITWLLVFTVPLLFVSQIAYAQTGMREAIIGAIAGVVGMIPEGLVLLTSVVMATAVVRLAKKSALIQELAAVEMLARVDTVCVDKTGTLTNGHIVLDSFIDAKPLHAIYTAKIAQAVLAQFAQISDHPNASMVAIAQACKQTPVLDWSLQSTVAFSSARKWSALSFAGQGTWVLGAPDIVLKQNLTSFPSAVQTQIIAGKRVLVLAHTDAAITQDPVQEKQSLPQMQAVLYIVLSEELRSNVVDTLAYFKSQGITLKVISGDSADTVAAIAHTVGISDAHASFDATTLPADMDQVAVIAEQNVVFGRVTPSQKQMLVRGLQANGHVVAMVGDGVNDVLALKTADFGIAMGSGADATRTIAQLILLKNDFGVLPEVIAEGRRVISNMERTANLFIVKTTYAFLFVLAVQLARVPFPFLPRHLTLVGFFTIGVPALLLSFAKSNARAYPGFVARVLNFSLPMGAVLSGVTLMTYAIIRQIFINDIAFARTGATITLIVCAFSVLFLLEPKTNWGQRFITLLLMIAFVLVLVLPMIQHFFALRMLPFLGWAVVVGTLALGVSLIRILGNKLLHR